MSREWCPKCKQSYFEPGKTPKVYVCKDGTPHPKISAPMDRIAPMARRVLGRMR